MGLRNDANSSSEALSTHLRVPPLHFLLLTVFESDLHNINNMRGRIRGGGVISNENCLNGRHCESSGYGERRESSYSSTTAAEKGDFQK
jgi:hypothetical protein